MTGPLTRGVAGGGVFGLWNVGCTTQSIIAVQRPFEAPRPRASQVLKSRTAFPDMGTSLFVTSATPGPALPALNASFRRTLRAADKSERTVKSYTEAVGLLQDQPAMPPT